MAGGIAKYLTFSFRLTSDELIIDSGIFQKQHRVIPLVSVQNVAVTESVLQRAFGVATLTVETATGGSQADAEFAVLAREAAKELRTRILGRRAAAPIAESAHEGGATERIEPRATPVVHLELRDLVVAGATANQAGLIVASLLGALQFLDDVPYLEHAGRVLERLPWDSVSSAVLLGTATVVILLVVGWLLSILGSVVGYYDFTVTREGEQLHRHHGLLNRSSTVIPLKRIQAIRIEESILRRPLGLAAARVVTAGASGPGGGTAETAGIETIAPIGTASRVPAIIQAIMTGVDYPMITWQKVHPRSRSRDFTRYSVTLGLLGVAVGVWEPAYGAVLFALIVPAGFVAAWQYRNRAYATAGELVATRNGVLNRVTWLVPIQKLQTVHLRESPLQRRHGLASVLLDTAGAGHATARDLGWADAATLVGSLRAYRGRDVSLRDKTV